MKRLSPLDATFLYMESARTPMHVGSLMTFKLPKDAPKDFFKILVNDMRSQPFMPPPFDSRLMPGIMSKLRPAWVKAPLDMDYHIRHSALPKPGGERDLGSLVQRLHSHPMDFDRPLWEAHIIEGLKGGRFAMYFKAHHCAIDGMGAMANARKWLKDDPNDLTPPGPMGGGKKHARKPHKDPIDVAREVFGQTRASIFGLGELARRLLDMYKGEHSIIKASMHTPKSMFNVEVTQQRRLGTQLIKLERFKNVSKSLGVTVNDVTLAVVGGAVRKYLLEQGQLPSNSLTCSVPIGLERPSDSGGNAAAGFVCELGTDIDDPLKRIMNINAATKRAKNDLHKMSRPALDNLALSGLLPLLLGQVTGTLHNMDPMFNFVVSNVVLSKEKLYVMGAELEAMYPISFLFDGYALNVTVIGYAENVAVGFIGARDAIPKLQSLAVYAGDAMTELEKAAGLTPAPAKPKPKPRAKAPAKPRPKKAA